MNPPHPFLHLHRRQTPSDTPTHNNSNNTFDPSSFLHSQPSSSSTFYSTPIVADRTIVTDPRSSSSSFSEQHTSSSTPSLPYTTTITPLFRPTPHPTQFESSAALATSSAITAGSTEAAAATASNINTVRKSSPSPACEACMVATSESRRQHQQQRAPSPRSTRLPSPRHQQQFQQQQQQQALITPEFDIVQHPIRDTVWIVSALLSLMAHKNDGQYNPLVDPITPFHSRAVPRISIEAYLTRILQFIPFTNEVLLNVLVFLDRIGGLGGIEMTIGALAESHGGSGNGSNRVDSSTYLTKDAIVAVPSSTSSHMRSLSSYPSDITSSTGTSFPSSTFTTDSSAATLPGSTSGQVQSSRGHTCHHFARSLSSPSSSSTTARMESSSCISRASFIASASNEADPDSFTPSSSFTSSSSCSSTTSCIHPTTTTINNNNNNNNSNNSDLPIVHKRGRESEIHEHQQQRVNGGGSSLDPSESSTSSSYSSSYSSSSTSPSTFSSSSVATTPTPSRSIATVQQQTPYCDGDSRDASERQAKRTRFQDPIATERVMTTSSATVDAQITPGGATPVLTPKMTAAPNGFRVNSFNIHRLLITCLMVAAKFTSDLFYSNARYAKVGGLSLPELNQLELVFLFTTQFDLNVKEEELQRVGNALLRFKNHREATANTTATAPISQPSLPAPPAAIAAQVARTVVVISNSVHHPSSVNLTATINNSNDSDVNASNSDGRYGSVATALRADTSTTTTATTSTTATIANAAVTAETSSDMVVDSRHQPPRAGRFSIPSPTSPKTGPMSDRGLLQKPIPSQPSSSPSSSTPSSMASMSTTVSSTATASPHAGSNGQATTTVVASGSRSQPPQLLSPPEEKHTGWTEGDVDVHMTTPMQTSSALSSSMPSRPN